MMQTILLPGGAGFIGSHVAAELLDRGYGVVIVDDLSNARPDVIDRLETITGRRPVFYRADMADIAEGINELMADLEDIRDEAQEMLDASKRNGKLLQIGFVRRFGKDAMAFKKLAEDGIIGDVYYAKATYLRKNGCPGGWFGDKRFSGGGPLIDLGVHVIDLSRYLAGNPKPVSAISSATPHF